MTAEQGELPGKSPLRSKSEILFSLFALICGAMIVGGVFMPWFHISKSVWGFTISYSGSGWEMATHNSLLIQAFAYLSGRTFPQAYFVLGGGILLICISIFALMIPSTNMERLKIKLRIQGSLAALTSLVSFGMTMWFLAYILSLKDYLRESGISVNSFGFGYGFYLSVTLLCFVLVVGIVTVAKALRKTKGEDSPRV